MSQTIRPIAKRPTLFILWVEMLAIFFVLPGLVALVTDPKERVRPFTQQLGLENLYDLAQGGVRFLIPMLIAIGLVAAAFLVLDKSFDNRRLWGWRETKPDLRRLLLLFVGLGLGLFGLGILLESFTDVFRFAGRDGTVTTAFLRLPREAPFVLLLIAIGYPWLSAYPQEITHRAFFFHRYRALMPTTWLIAVNAIAFMWLHAPFWSPEAFALTLPGGVLFAITYQRTKSTLAATIEHALYGWWAFFTGFGWFVFTGSIGR